MAIDPHTAKIIAQAVISTITDEENTEDDSLINGHRYVDLGLSVMWADWNIGSDNP